MKLPSKDRPKVDPETDAESAADAAARPPVDPGVRRSRRVLGASFGLVVAALGATLCYSSCGTREDFNVYRPLVRSAALKSSQDAQLEEARVDLDKRAYNDALGLLQPIVDDPSRDSDEARVLYVSAKLGAAGVEIWSILSDILTTLGDNSKQSSSGINDVLNQLSASVLGTGTVRANRMTALSEAIEALENAPDPSTQNIKDTACIVAAFLAPATLADAAVTVQGVTASLEQIRSSATGGGTQCPDIGQLDTAAAALPGLVTSINFILQAARNCSFLDISQAASQVNNITAMLKTLTANVDKGCDDVPTCPASVPGCQSYFPPCVQEALSVGTGDAKAGDGVISACELILHCTDPQACFGS